MACTDYITYKTIVTLFECAFLTTEMLIKIWKPIIINQIKMTR